MIKKPEDILKKWMNAINKGDIEGILALYSKNAVLIPTFSNRLLNNPREIREYFVRLRSRSKLSVSLHDKTLIVRSIKNDMYALFGIYCWLLDIDGEPLRFEARFSYILDLALSSPIIHHHSSQIPRML